MNRSRARKVHLARSQRRSAKRRQNRGQHTSPAFHASLSGAHQTKVMWGMHNAPRPINIMDWLDKRHQQRRDANRWKNAPDLGVAA